MSAGSPLPGTPVPMHTWKGANGLMIAGDSWGDPKGPLVLLQHGGGSMGGGTSLTAVGEDRVDATALVLVDIAHRVEPDGVKKIRAFMGQKPDGFSSLEEVADAIAGYQPHRKRKTNLDGLAKNVR